MKFKLTSFAAVAICLLFLASGAFAGTVPYSDPANQGIQAYGGNLALTFDVTAPITVTSLGVFNASGSGFITGSIQVVIFNTTTNTMVTPVVTFSGASYPLGALGFDVFQSIKPVTLGPGSYEVDAVGFSSADLNGNKYFGSTGPILNGGGRITFTGAAYDGSGSLDDPLTCPSCVSPPGQWSQFDAGTFEFTPVPEPSTLATLLGSGIFGLAAVLRRKLI